MLRSGDKEIPVPKPTRMGLAVTGINFWIGHLFHAEDGKPAPEFDDSDVVARGRAIHTKEGRDRVRRFMKAASERNERVIYKAIRAYDLAPVLRFEPDGKLDIRLEAWPGDKRQSDFSEEEAHAISNVIYLAQIGQLELLQTCPQCQTLFQQSRGGQVNCSAYCSKRAHSKKPHELKRRAAKARKKYAEVFGDPKTRVKSQPKKQARRVDKVPLIRSTPGAITGPTRRGRTSR